MTSGIRENKGRDSSVEDSFRMTLGFVLGYKTVPEGLSTFKCFL